MLIFVAAGIVLIATHPQLTLVAIAYSYLASAFIGWRSRASDTAARASTPRAAVPGE